MLEFMMQYWSSILVVSLFAGTCVMLLKKGYEKKVKQMLFYLVCKAEELYGTGTGELKYHAVVTWLYERLPVIVKVLFTTKQIDLMIEEAVDKMKDYLNDNAKAYGRVVLKGVNGHENTH